MRIKYYFKKSILAALLACLVVSMTVSFSAAKPIVDQIIDIPENAAELTQEVSAFLEISQSLENEMYKVGATDVVPLSYTVLYSDEATLTYQWYQNSTLETETADTVEGAIEYEFIPPTDEVGARYYFCKLTHEYVEDDEEIVTTYYSKAAYISVTDQQIIDIPCSTCHSSDVRLIHKDVPKDGSKCGLCHKSEGTDWSALTFAKLDNAKVLDTYETGCGIGKTKCHGESSSMPFHGSTFADNHVSELSSADETATAEATCSSLTGGCHVKFSSQSPFWFGGENALYAHNDYWNALKSKTTTQSAQGKFDTFKKLDASCLSCHIKDKKPAPTDFACSSCHKGAAYWPGVLHECLGVASAKKGKAAATQSEKDNQSIAQKIGVTVSAISSSVSKLLGLDDSGNDEDLRAATVTPLAQELPRPFFPVMSLLDEEQPFITP